MARPQEVASTGNDTEGGEVRERMLFTDAVRTVSAGRLLDARAGEGLGGSEMAQLAAADEAAAGEAGRSLLELPSQSCAGSSVRHSRTAADGTQRDACIVVVPRLFQEQVALQKPCDCAPRHSDTLEAAATMQDLHTSSSELARPSGIVFAVPVDDRSNLDRSLPSVSLQSGSRGEGAVASPFEVDPWSTINPFSLPAVHMQRGEEDPVASPFSAPGVSQSIWPPGSCAAGDCAPGSARSVILRGNSNVISPFASPDTSWMGDEGAQQ